MLYKILVTILRPFIYLIFRIEVIGDNHIDKGNVIIASNHSSNWDPVILSIVIRDKIHWMAKKELFNIKILKYIFTKLGAIPVDRKMGLKAIRDSSKILKEEKVLGIFPEGTRVKEFDLQNAKPGIALIAARNKSTIVPVYIKHRDSFFNKTKIYIGEKIEIFNSQENFNSDDYKKYGEMILKEIYKLENCK